MHVEDGVLQATAGGVLNGRLDLGALVPLVEWGDGDELKMLVHNGVVRRSGNEP